jgi:hypothetical protein
VNRTTISQKLRASKGSRKNSHIGRERVSITIKPRRRMLRQSPFSSMEHPITSPNSRRPFPRQLSNNMVI